MAANLEQVIAINEQGLNSLAGTKLDKVKGFRLDELLVVGAALADYDVKRFTSYNLARTLGLKDDNVQDALSHAESSNHVYRDGKWYYMHENSYPYLFAHAFEILSADAQRAFEKHSPDSFMELKKKSYRAQVKDMIEHYMLTTCVPDSSIFLNIQIRESEIQLTLADNVKGNPVQRVFSAASTGYDSVEQMARLAENYARQHNISNVTRQKVGEFVATTPN